LGTAEQHGGMAVVSAREGGGAVFTIELPAAESPADAKSEEAETSGPGSERRALELLVVDDEPMVADVTRRILEACGHSVRVASDPNEVLGIWAEHGEAIDLVICDVAMAHMRGPELVALLAERGVPPRVLFITGYSEEAVRSELGHPVLTKPFTVAALRQAINDALG
jgi:CheY-like chemotaxis protein